MVGLSAVSAQWDSLFGLYATLGWIIGSVVVAFFLYGIFKYRVRHGASEPADAPKEGYLPKERGTFKAALIITVIVTAVLIPLSIGTLQTVDLIEKMPEKSTIVVKVKAFQWGWEFTYPNGKVITGELRVPKGEKIIFEVTSVDVFHNFGIVGFKIKADAIPGEVNRIWLDPQETGTYDILCFELCGVGHSLMKGQFVVMEPEDFNAWILS